MRGTPPDRCANCGADLPRKAKACPECGADDETGWAETRETPNLDLPDAEFDYDAYLEREFGGGGTKPRGIGWVWWVAAILILLGFLGFWAL